MNCLLGSTVVACTNNVRDVFFASLFCSCLECEHRAHGDVPTSKKVSVEFDSEKNGRSVRAQTMHFAPKSTLGHTEFFSFPTVTQYIEQDDLIEDIIYCVCPPVLPMQFGSFLTKESLWTVLSTTIVRPLSFRFIQINTSPYFANTTKQSRKGWILRSLFTPPSYKE